ncbi:hypothetical protein BC833DRAFT_590430 [Globomyces pollinis-pini]|nr:hypothetical protein BC833DRAFT_590430 [Globomyces pollinis-pini]KAJ2996374.1 hypothetical protein HDV02_006585 [Globomyces sp. JEL0801]
MPQDIRRRTKRAPIRPATIESDIYVSRKTIIPTQLKRVETLFKKNHKYLTVHGLGFAIQKAVQLSLAIKAKYPNVELDVQTSTVTLIDDITPVDLDEDDEVDTRNNSSIHIKITRI